MNMIFNGNTVSVDAEIFDPDTTFDCGQCFRWVRLSEGVWRGTAYGRVLTVSKTGNKILFEGASQSSIENIWSGYFDLGRDYSAIKQFLSDDNTLKAAIAFAPGIRILRQEPWETLCSFIISQNNNIPRIKGIVSRLCENFGDKIGEEPEGEYYAFPEAQRIAALSEEELAPLRCGFRAAYIMDAARRVSSGSIDFKALENLPVDKAREVLMQIKGVGPKVADCTLLFGCGRLDAFPRDVWIKRVLARFYPDGFPDKYMEYGGIAQQYLFHYARCCPESGFSEKTTFEQAAACNAHKK